MAGKKSVGKCCGVRRTTSTNNSRQESVGGRTEPQGSGCCTVGNCGAVNFRKTSGRRQAGGSADRSPVDATAAGAGGSLGLIHRETRPSNFRRILATRDAARSPGRRISPARPRLRPGAQAGWTTATKSPDRAPRRSRRSPAPPPRGRLRHPNRSRRPPRHLPTPQEP